MGEILRFKYLKKLLKLNLFFFFFFSLSAIAEELMEPTEEGTTISELLELPLENLLEMKVTTTSRRSETFFNSPGIVSIITAEEIALFGANDLIEVLSRIIGIQPVFSSFVINNTVPIRGDRLNPNNTHILILLDGNPISQDSYAGYYLQSLYASFPISIISKIEIVRGPGSVLYGTSAFSGVINIITKTSGTPLSGTIKYGTFGTSGVNAFSNLYNIESDLRMTSALYYLNTAGWTLNANGTNGSISDSVYQHGNIGLTSSLQYKNLRFSSLLTHSDQFTWRIPTNGGQGYLKNTRIFGNLEYDFKLNDHWRLTPSISTTIGSTDLLYRTNVSQPRGDPTPVNQIDTYDSRLELTLQGPLTQKLNLVTGTTINHLYGGFLSPAFTVDTPWVQVWWRVYTQLDYMITSRLKLILGGQLNKVPNLDPNLVPRLGSVFRITNDLWVKALYSEAFRAPLPGETIVSFPNLIINNPNVNFESVGTMDLQLALVKPTYQFSLTYYHSKQNNLIVRIPVEPSMVTFGNVGPLFIDGIEFESKLSTKKDLFFTGTATYQQNHDANGNTDVMMTPRFITKLGLGYSFRYAKLGIFNSFLTAYTDNRVNFPNRLTVNPLSGPYSLLSANLTIDLRSLLQLHNTFPRMNLSVYGNNLLNESYYVPEVGLGFINTLPGGPGRAIYASIEASI